MSRLVALLGPIPLLVAACGENGTAASGDVSAVAAVYPLAWIAEQAERFAVALGCRG